MTPWGDKVGGLYPGQYTSMINTISTEVIGSVVQQRPADMLDLFFENLQTYSFLHRGNIMQFKGNSSRPSATYMHQLIASALVQIMACRQFGTKPLSEVMLGYLPIWPLGTNPCEILIKIQNFSFTKMACVILTRPHDIIDVSCEGPPVKPTGFSRLLFLLGVCWYRHR